MKTNIYKSFEKRNIDVRVQKLYGKMLIESTEDTGILIQVLKKIFGIAKIVPVHQFGRNYKELKENIIPLLTKKHSKEDTLTFAVDTNRAYKKIDKNQMEINREIGGIIDDFFPNFSVDLDNPDLRISIDIRGEGIFVAFEEHEGLRGLPEGTEGKALLLLSGGIDSPVAGFLGLKRGLKIDFIHYSTPPFTSDLALKKVIALAKKIKKFSYRNSIKFFNIKFTNIQKQIVQKCDKKAATLVLRAAMIEIADTIAQKKGYNCLLTGDNLGQVASQTIQALSSVSRFSETVIIRPLISYEKLETIEIAKKIDTYEKSIEPYEDCCSIFVPDHPYLKPQYKKVLNEFSKLNIEEFKNSLTKNIEIIKL
jgi:thiamine biosynthesis protein ThiI